MPKVPTLNWFSHYICLFAMQIVMKHLFALYFSHFNSNILIDIYIYFIEYNIYSIYRYFIHIWACAEQQLSFWFSAFCILLPSFVDWGNKALKLSSKLNPNPNLNPSPKPNQRKVNFISISILFLILKKFFFPFSFLYYLFRFYACCCHCASSSSFFSPIFFASCFSSFRCAFSILLTSL